MPQAKPCPADASLQSLRAIFESDGREAFSIASNNLFLTTAAAILQIDGAERLAELVEQLRPLFELTNRVLN